MREAVLSRIHLREHSALAWGLGALGAGALAALLVQNATGSNDLNGVLVMFPAAVGLSFGSYRALLRSPQHLSPGAPRVARSRHTGIDDYTTSAERWATRLVPATVVVATGAALIVWALAPVTPPGGVLVPVLLVAAALSLAGAWLLLRKGAAIVIEHSQHAHTDLELAWDDALRSRTIRDLQDVAVALGLAASFVVLAMAGSWVVTPEARAGAETLTMWWGTGALVVGLVCWSMLLIPWLRGRAQGNPSAKLWAGHQFQEA